MKRSKCWLKGCNRGHTFEICKHFHHEAVEDPPVCYSCRVGHFVRRMGKFGEFFGCCQYPKCKTTLSLWDINSMYDPDLDEPYFGM